MNSDGSSGLPMDAPMQVVRLEAFDGKTCVVSTRGECAAYEPVVEELHARIRRTPIGDECAIVVDASGSMVRFSAVLREARPVGVLADRILLDNDVEVDVGESILVRTPLAEDRLVRRDAVLGDLGPEAGVSYVRTLDAAGAPTGRGHLIWVDLS